MKDIPDIVEALQDLIDSKKLLDRILQYYSVYNMKFDIPDYEKNRFSTGPNHKTTLETAIRSYLKFNDSE